MISKLTEQYNNKTVETQTKSETFTQGKVQDNKEMAKKIETVFLTELLKVMFAETSFNKDRTSSTYMTIIIPEVAKMMAERDMGIGEFLTNNTQHFSEEGKTEELKSNLLNKTSKEQSIDLKPINLDNKKRNEDKTSLPENIFLPVSGRISSFYGLRVDPIDGTLKNHYGIDIAVSSGTIVRAVSSGKVIYSGYAKGYGNCVIIDHGNGFQTLYAHHSKNLVKAGQEVSQDTVIALSGNTGRATGPHLHFEVRKDGKPLDPIAMINKSEKSPIL